LLGGAGVSIAVFLSAVSREADILDGDALSARELIVALILDGPCAVDDEVGCASSSGLSSGGDVREGETLAKRIVAVVCRSGEASDSGVSGILASDGEVRREDDEDGRSGISLSDDLCVSVDVSTEVRNGPCSDGGLGTDSVIIDIIKGDSGGDTARRGDSGVSSDGRSDGSSALNSDGLRGINRGTSGEDDGDGLFFRDTVSTSISDSPCADDFRGGGTVNSGGTVSLGDGDRVASIVSSGSSSGFGSSGVTILAVEGDVRGEEVKEGLDGITDTDDLVLRTLVSTNISNSPSSGDLTIATSDGVTISVSGDLNVAAAVVSSGSGTSDREVIKVGSTLDGDGAGESNKVGGNAITKGDELVSACGKTASISDSPCAGDGAVAVISRGAVSLDNFKGVAVISGSGSCDGKSGSTLENSISGEGGRDKLRSSCISDGESLDISV